jgi:hypothetical protein
MITSIISRINDMELGVREICAIISCTIFILRSADKVD